MLTNNFINKIYLLFLYIFYIVLGNYDWWNFHVSVPSGEMGMQDRRR